MTKHPEQVAEVSAALLTLNEAKVGSTSFAAAEGSYSLKLDYQDTRPDDTHIVTLESGDTDGNYEVARTYELPPNNPTVWEEVVDDRVKVGGCLEDFSGDIMDWV